MLNHKIVVGAFHKSGTVLLNRTFREISDRLGLNYRHARRAGDSEKWTQHQRALMSRPDGKKIAGLARDWDIGFAPRAEFSRLAIAQPHRGLVILRDPRDVVISGMHYHLTARELWLQRPKVHLGGMSYQAALNALATLDERLIFEMDGAAKKTIPAMLNWTHPPQNFTITRLELLATDYDFVEFTRIFTFLGFAGDALEVALQVARDVSLFSRDAHRRERLAASPMAAATEAERAARKEAKQCEAAAEDRPQPNVHVRTGGRPAQWRTEFSPAVLAAFVERFGDAPERLGYPPSRLAAKPIQGAA